MNKENWLSIRKNEWKGFTIFLVLILMKVFIGGCITQDDLKNNQNGKNKEIKLNEETMVVKSNQVFYAGGQGRSTRTTVIKYHYTITSSEPVEIYIVPSISDFRLIKPGEKFLNYPRCRGIQTLRYDKECVINDDGGIVILNKNLKDAIIDIKVYYFSGIEKEEDKKEETYTTI